MKRNNLLILLITLLGIHTALAQDDLLETQKVKTGGTTFYYQVSEKKSDAVVLLFHDWFGVSDLSYEMANMIINKGYDVIIMDLYKGKSAKTNPEAAALMNSMDQANAWNYIDEVLKKEGSKYNQVVLWGFSLGTVPASQTAIKNNQLVDGLILFYGNVTQDKEQLSKLNFPSLMVMGSKDNPNGAIEFFKGVNEKGGEPRLFIYPGARHAFAQKLFNNGANYDEDAKEASLQVAFQFLKETID